MPEEKENLFDFPNPEELRSRIFVDYRNGISLILEYILSELKNHFGKVVKFDLSEVLIVLKNEKQFCFDLSDDFLEFLFRKSLEIVGERGWVVVPSDDGLSWSVYEEVAPESKIKKDFI